MAAALVPMEGLAKTMEPLLSCQLTVLDLGKRIATGNHRQKVATLELDAGAAIERAPSGDTGIIRYTDSHNHGVGYHKWSERKGVWTDR